MKTRLLFLGVIISLFVACKENKDLPDKSDKSLLIKSKLSSNSGLSSWQDMPRKRIEDYVKMVTDTTSANFIPVADRIAVFDNDGTLWSEQPIPFQALFIFSQVKAMAPKHPEWKNDPVLNGIINDDLEPLKKAGVAGLLKAISKTQNEISETEFNTAVKDWINTAKDKKFNKLYKENVFLPMIELLKYLRENGFKTFIVSGGGADFMRVWSEEVYGIPPYQVIGSYSDAKYELVNDKPVIMKSTDGLFVDDKTQKPVAIHRFIGKTPVFCGGNSDGDQAMMQYTHGSKYKSMIVLVHHTDSVREYKYDLKTLSGHLESALVEAKQKNWMVVDVEKDWKKVFAFEK